LGHNAFEERLVAEFRKLGFPIDAALHDDFIVQAGR